MKKILAILVAALLFAAPVMASESFYYMDEAVRGGYEQVQLPVQGAVVNGAIAYGDLGASANFAAVQALPMQQSMAGAGNGGFTSMSAYENGSTQINLDRIVLNTTGGWNGDYYDYYYGYNYYNINVYNPQYNYYYNYYPIYNQNGYGEYDVNFSWTNLDFYEYHNKNIQLVEANLPAVLHLAPIQAASQSILFESPGMKLQMDQSAMQGGVLKVTGYSAGEVRYNGCN